MSLDSTPLSIALTLASWVMNSGRNAACSWCLFCELLAVVRVSAKS